MRDLDRLIKLEPAPGLEACEKHEYRMAQLRLVRDSLFATPAEQRRASYLLSGSPEYPRSARLWDYSAAHLVRVVLARWRE